MPALDREFVSHIVRVDNVKSVTDFLNDQSFFLLAPATLAEFKLNGDGGKDYYDVSNVDGSNLPVLISNNKGCPSPSCKVDLNPGCPEDRMKVKDGRGTTIGCLSACQVCKSLFTPAQRQRSYLNTSFFCRLT
jgi:hypothetical protein